MRLSTALFGAFLTMAAAGAAAAGQFNPPLPGVFGLIGELLRGGDPPDGALLTFDVLDEAEFLELLYPSEPAAEAPPP